SHSDEDRKRQKRRHRNVRGGCEGCWDQTQQVGREDEHYRACVHRNGQLVIGANYTQEMGLKPGDEFIIQLGHKHIHLRQINIEVEKEDENNEEE
ncbi:MAG: hypothetical protein F6K39_47675, partial [Okeania sp. SIO3B3]|nr:hypothetical protein [Okeania sp. SIO3B3]